jgi:hypothetical protein
MRHGSYRQRVLLGTERARQMAQRGIEGLVVDLTSCGLVSSGIKRTLPSGSRECRSANIERGHESDSTPTDGPFSEPQKRAIADRFRSCD